MDNFIVSARKYRPATFASVVGQSHITSTLRNAIARNQLAHAYLFCGPRGVGKTTCARIFAKAINCLRPGPDAEACNECESCRAFDEGRSFNIHELDAASNNSVDDIRSLTDQVRIPPQVGRYSVYIIDEVHMLSVQAFNAFLKTLEEPPAHAVFILATTEKHKIIPTILSRCQIYDFNRIRVEDGVGYLKYIASQEGVTYDEESLHIIARKADGGMRDALSMFDKVVSFCGQNLAAAQVAETLNVLDYDTYFQMTSLLLAGDYTAALLLFDEVLRKGFSAQTFLAGLNGHFRDLLMCRNPQTLPLLEVTGGVADRYRSQAAECPVPLLFEAIDLLSTVDASLKTATNQRLHVELSLMKLCGLGQKKNNDTLTPALPELTGRTTASGTPTAEPHAATTPIRTPQVAAPVAEAVAPASPSAPSAPAPSVRPAAETAGDGTSPSQNTAERRPPMPAPNVPTVPPAGAPAAAASERPAAAPRPSTGGVSLSGRSILSLLGGETASSADEDDNGDEAPEAGDESFEESDEPAAARLEQALVRLSDELMKERPRLGVVFREATVHAEGIVLKVPNESLYDEVTHRLTDIQKRLCELAFTKTPVAIRVVVTEDKSGLKPVKVEDRLRFLTQKNPLVTRLRQSLDLDIE
ncbi:DNA polymerase III subunit gamma/tau [uncultured Alistipes sp.]|uniref:DNA polymerase III subunit gamma/tau n=1 Tax=uncultured Alistipes sp. TaxID=538949 RepID=UPI0026F088EF|nr:DNA polymerase III subunit gamma/tau [uncultured Alistipes sp.]